MHNYTHQKGTRHALLTSQPSAYKTTQMWHQLGLAYSCKTWAYPMNTLSACEGSDTVAFLLLLDTILLPQAGITHYTHSYMTRQHSTKLLCKKKVCQSKLIFKV